MKRLYTVTDGRKVQTASAKMHPFTNIDPDNYSATDDMKHLYFKDYKHLKGVSFDDNTETLASKIIAAIGLFIVLLVLIFI